MSQFAATTGVPIDRTRTEIEKVLSRYGAATFGYMTRVGQVVILFEAKERKIKISIPMPTGTSEKENQLARSRWRALLLVIKAKLESVSAGIETFEEAFYSNIVLPNGRTVYEETQQRVAIAYQSGQVQALLPDYTT
jgi:hypothetical protein